MQQGILRTGNILWAGWLIVGFGLGIWVGRFGLSDQAWVRGAHDPTNLVVQGQRRALDKRKEARPCPRSTPAPGRPCPHTRLKTPQPVTMKDLPQLAWHQMSIGQRRTTLRLFNSLRLPCGCGQTLARCIQADLNHCPRLRELVDDVMTSVYHGDTTKTIRRKALRLSRRQAKHPASLPASRPTEKHQLQAGRVYFVPVSQANPDYGSSHAKLTVVIFSDFVCPHCWDVMDEVKRLEQRYGQAEVRVVFRHFPLPQHPQAALAAEASLAAHAQGKFWQYHNKLFANQGKFDLPSLIRYAAELGLDTKAFHVALRQRRYRRVVQHDIALGRRLKLPGVPFVFINGMPVMGQASMAEVAAAAWRRAEALLQKGVKRWDLYATLIKYGRREP